MQWNHYFWSSLLVSFKEKILIAVIWISMYEDFLVAHLLGNSKIPLVVAIQFIIIIASIRQSGVFQVAAL